METEFSELIDILISRGLRHSQILAKMQNAVLNEISIHFPKVNRAAISITINEQTGEVQILSAGKNVTPKNFAPIAERCAFRALIQLLKTSEEQKASQLATISDTSASKFGEILRNGFSALFFWVYNGIYLVMAIFFVINFLTNSDFRNQLLSTFSNLNLFRSAALVFLCLTPLFSVGAALKSAEIKTTHNYSRLLFFFEIPLLTLLFISYNAFTDAAPYLWFFVLMLIFLIVSIFLDLIKFRARSLLSLVATTILQQSSLITAGYLVTLYSFFFPPILGTIMKVVIRALSDVFLPSYNYSFNIIAALFSLLLGGIGVFGLTILIIVPFIVLYLIFRQFSATHFNLQAQVGKKTALQTHAAIGMLYVIFFALCSFQPNISPYIAKLNSLPYSTTFEEKAGIARELLSHEEEIKRGIDDALNYRTRYPFSKDDTTLKRGLQEVLGLDEVFAEMIQNVFLCMAYPFVYQGETQDAYVLSQNFEYLFGKSWQETTYPVIPLRNVKLVSHNVNAQKSNDNLFAKITITDEFENTSFRNEEVIYEFSLAEGSTVTELKLGPNLEFPGIFAPRGAAAKIYNQELNRSRDPALLEEVGPRQYRLRVFPIPAKQSWQAALNQKVLFSYITPLTSQGFSLPVYSKKQNLKDESAIISSNLDQVKTEVASTKNDLCQMKNSKLNSLPCNNERGINAVNSLNAKKIAILLDVSYLNKNNNYIADLKNLLKQNLKLTEKNSFDLYFFNDSLSLPQTLSLSWLDQNPEVVYFGKSDAQKIMADFKTDYDLILVATSSDPQLNNLLPSSVYFIHEKTDSFFDALNLYALTEFGKQEKIAPLNNFLAVSIERQIEKKDDDFAGFLINRKYIMSLISSGKLSQDELNQLAKQSGVITTLTSLVALVNETQIQNLEEFSKELDKFSFESQPSSQNTIIQPAPVFDRSSTGMFNNGLQNLSLPSAGGGDLSIERPHAFAISSSSSGMISIFVLANIVLLGFGGIFFIIGKLRKRKA